MWSAWLTWEIKACLDFMGSLLLQNPELQSSCLKPCLQHIDMILTALFVQPFTEIWWPSVMGCSAWYLYLCAPVNSSISASSKLESDLFYSESLFFSWRLPQPRLSHKLEAPLSVLFHKNKTSYWVLCMNKWWKSSHRKCKCSHSYPPCIAEANNV